MLRFFCRFNYKGFNSAGQTNVGAGLPQAATLQNQVPSGPRQTCKWIWPGLGIGGKQWPDAEYRSCTGVKLSDSAGLWAELGPLVTISYLCMRLLNIKYHIIQALPDYPIWWLFFSIIGCFVVLSILFYVFKCSEKDVRDFSWLSKGPPHSKLSLISSSLSSASILVLAHSRCLLNFYWMYEWTIKQINE